MTDTMLHRGPDGQGVWISGDGYAALGHRRLAIVDLSEDGRQPMGNSDGSVQVTFNGEIYNFLEIKKDLQSRGYRFRSKCDTEVLIYLYEEYGKEMIDRLDGDFAFAIWDDRRKQLLAARDRAGVKPFYYTQVGDLFLFASEIKALLQHPAVSAEVHESALYHYLTYLVTPAPETLFKNIFKLPAAGQLSLQADKDHPTLLIEKFWNPFPGQTVIDKDDPDGQLEELFTQAVSKRMMSDVPVGVLFSGGVDSTLNAACFQKLISPGRVRTYNVSVADDPVSQQEAEFARNMAHRLGTEHHHIEITEQDMLRSAVEILTHQDEPVSDPVSVPLFFITRYAKETGTTVLHAGEGADELFCGYENYRRFLAADERYWQKLSLTPRWAQRLGARAVSHWPSPRAHKMADILSRKAAKRELFMSSAVAFYEAEKPSILSRDYARRCAALDSYDVVQPLHAEIGNYNSDASLLQRISFLELSLRLPELLLMRVDKMSMAHSVEVRVPFLDSALMNFALAAPDRFKLRDQISKEPIKRMAMQYVPKSLIYRAKTGFSAPIVRWFRSDLGAQMLDSVNSRGSDWDRYFNVKELRRRLTRGPRTTNEAFQLWVIFKFMLWRDTHLSQPARQVA